MPLVAGPHRAHEEEKAGNENTAEGIEYKDHPDKLADVIDHSSDSEEKEKDRGLY